MSRASGVGRITTISLPSNDASSESAVLVRVRVLDRGPSSMPPALPIAESLAPPEDGLDLAESIGLPSLKSMSAGEGCGSSGTALSGPRSGLSWSAALLLCFICNCASERLRTLLLSSPKSGIGSISRCNQQMRSIGESVSGRSLLNSRTAVPGKPNVCSTKAAARSRANACERITRSAVVHAMHCGQVAPPSSSPRPPSQPPRATSTSNRPSLSRCASRHTKSWLAPPNAAPSSPPQPLAPLPDPGGLEAIAFSSFARLVNAVRELESTCSTKPTPGASRVGTSQRPSNRLPRRECFALCVAPLHEVPSGKC
mmetsp:Transcript_117614/g.344383  ORF Transcript_117614/g.344383 Transcript_117614/m.344383 type:complete len:313 (+) Transcript_117614:452-1390(+)